MKREDAGTDDYRNTKVNQVLCLNFPVFKRGRGREPAVVRASLEKMQRNGAGWTQERVGRTGRGSKKGRKMGVFKVSRGRGQPQGKAREEEGSGNAAGSGWAGVRPPCCQLTYSRGMDQRRGREMGSRHGNRLDSGAGVRRRAKACERLCLAGAKPLSLAVGARA